MRFNKGWQIISKAYPWFGFFLLAVMAVYAVSMIFITHQNTLIRVSVILMALALIMGIVLAKTIGTNDDDVMTHIFDVMAVWFGAMATYALSETLGLSAVIGSAIIGLLGYVIIRKHEMAIYCGSFAGMVSTSLFAYQDILVIGLLCGLMYIMTKKVFQGYGGKLGTIAFTSTLFTFLIMGKSAPSVSLTYRFEWVMIISIIGVISTFYVKEKLNWSAVLASSLTTLIFSIPLLVFLSEYGHYTAVFFAASFVGMSSKQKLPTLPYVLVSGIVMALLFMGLSDVFIGLGGKLGLTAWISVLMIQPFIYGTQKMLKKKIK